MHTSTVEHATSTSRAVFFLIIDCDADLDEVFTYTRKRQWQTSIDCIQMTRTCKLLLQLELLAQVEDASVLAPVAWAAAKRVLQNGQGRRQKLITTTFCPDGTSGKKFKLNVQQHIQDNMEHQRTRFVIVLRICTSFFWGAGKRQTFRVKKNLRILTKETASCFLVLGPCCNHSRACCLFLAICCVLLFYLQSLACLRVFPLRFLLAALFGVLRCSPGMTLRMVAEVCFQQRVTNIAGHCWKGRVGI